MGRVLFKVAQELNICTKKIVDFLEGKGLSIQNKPNAKITQEMYNELLYEFQSSNEMPDKLVHLNKNTSLISSLTASNNELYLDVGKKRKGFIKQTDKDEVIAIASSITEDRKLEEKNYVINKAIARYDVKIGDRALTLWFVNQSVDVGTRDGSDLVGNPIIIQGPSKVLKRRGEDRTVSKNSPLGVEIQKALKSSFSYTVNNSELKCKIDSKSTYIPTHNGDATNIEINPRVSLGQFSKFRSLSDISEQLRKQGEELKLLKEKEDQLKIDEQKRKKEEAQIEEKLRIAEEKKRIDEIEKVIQERKQREQEIEMLISKKQSFIVAQAALRSVFILDPQQVRLKTDHFFDDVIQVIDGGPGTGKTTLLIQRIKYLIDDIVLKDKLENVSPAIISKISSSQVPSWIFFSPSNLLYLYLKDAMAGEGLPADNATVAVWAEYKTILVKNYDLINPATKRPFLSDKRNKSKSYLTPSPDALTWYIRTFSDFLIDGFKIKFAELLDRDVSAFSWMKLAFSIKNYIGQSRIVNLDGLIRALNTLQRTYENKAGDVTKNLNDDLNRAAATLQVELNKNEELLTLAQKSFDEFKLSKEIVEPDDLETDEDTDEYEVQVQGEEILFPDWIFRKARAIVRKYALSSVDSKTSLTRKDKELLIIFPTLIELENISSIGERVYFQKYYVSILRGVGPNVLTKIPTNYKKFRKSIASKQIQFDQVNNEVLQYIVDNKNVRLHKDEQSFLIGFINNLLHSVQKISSLVYRRLSHKYKNGYVANSKSVIGLDEATDFHVVDIYAMISLRDMKYGSVSICGDVMQRLTTTGIREWSDIEPFAKKLDIGKLVTSYRQSPTLLKIASDIYQKSTGNLVNYSAKLEHDPSEPKALSFISSNEYDKVEWISKRIIEIYSAYGDSIPSIAIFHSDPNKIDQLTSQLNDLEELADVEINVKACKNGEILGTNNTVRVFDINHIKGLEFEAVFFYDLDNLLSSNVDNDLLLKNLYVGLSRAAFYTAVTLSNDWPAEISFLSSHFIENGSWKK